MSQPCTTVSQPCTAVPQHCIRVSYHSITLHNTVSPLHNTISAMEQSLRTVHQCLSTAHQCLSTCWYSSKLQNESWFKKSFKTCCFNMSFKLCLAKVSMITPATAKCHSHYCTYLGHIGWRDRERIISIFVKLPEVSKASTIVTVSCNCRWCFCLVHEPLGPKCQDKSHS